MVVTIYTYVNVTKFDPIYRFLLWFVDSFFSILFEIRLFNVSSIYQNIAVKNRFGVHIITF